LNAGAPLQRYIAFGILVAIALVVAVGVASVRRDVNNLEMISQDNVLWSANQLEVELLRFQSSLALLDRESSDEALDQLHERFDILWSRVDIVKRGRVGGVLREHDREHGALTALANYLEEIDPVIMQLDPGDAATIDRVLVELDAIQQPIRLFTLRVVRADSAATAMVRDRIEASSRLTGLVGTAAMLISAVALLLIMRDNQRQKQISEMSRRQAEAAEAASAAKSRFLTMMSHELRNPLHGILGPLALLDQSDMPQRYRRLVEQAQNSGRSMVNMLSGLLDYSEMQESRLVLKRDPFRSAVLAARIGVTLKGRSREAAERVHVTVRKGTPELVYGDIERFRQVFVYLGDYLLQPDDRIDLDLELSHDGANLVGIIRAGGENGGLGWKLDLITGMNEKGHEPFSTDALGLLIGRGLISSAKGVLTLAEDAEGRRIVRVSLPARPVVFERIRVHLETRSDALAAIYRAALKSDRVAFTRSASEEPVEIVLVDSTSVSEGSLMLHLRARFPNALFVSLGLPESPSLFDDIVEAPHDMASLRESVLGRLVS
jgi:signal transduction histidine kinase